MVQIEINGWIDLCAVDAVSKERGKFVACGSRRLAVFRLKDGSIHVIDDVCPHAGGSLAGGGIEDGRVRCRWHGWPFDIRSGHCPDNPRIKVATYPTRIVANRVQARL